MKPANSLIHFRGAQFWLLFSLCAVLLWERAPMALFHPQFWAEDAVVFYDQAQKAGANSLFLAHVGYLHEVPRAVALASVHMPAAWAPALFAWSTFGLALLCSAFLLRSRLGGTTWFGPAAAFCFCLVPHLSHEIFWCLTNLQWIFATLLLLLLALDPPATKTESWTLALLSALAGLTSPLSGVLLPALLARACFERRSTLLPALAAACSAGLAQAVSIAVHGYGMHESKLPDLNIVQNLELVGRRIFLQGFIPEAFWSTFNAHCALIGMAFLVFFVAGAFLVRGATRVYVLLLGAVFLMIFASIARTDPGARHYLWDLDNGGWGDRYFVPIRFGCALCLLVLACKGPRLLKIAALLFLGLMPIAGWNKFQAPALPDKEWSKYAPEIDARRSVEIPINPGWTYKYEAPAKR